MYTPDNTVAKYVMQKLLKMEGKIDKSTLIIRDCNICLLTINRKLDRKSAKIKN